MDLYSKYESKAFEGGEIDAPASLILGYIQKSWPEVSRAAEEVETNTYTEQTEAGLPAETKSTTVSAELKEGEGAVSIELMTFSAGGVTSPRSGVMVHLLGPKESNWKQFWGQSKWDRKAKSLFASLKSGVEG